MVPSKEMLNALREADKDGILASPGDNHLAEPITHPTDITLSSVISGDTIAFKNSQTILQNEFIEHQDNQNAKQPIKKVTNSVKVRPKNYKAKKKSKRKTSRKARRK